MGRHPFALAIVAVAIATSCGGSSPEPAASAQPTLPVADMAGMAGMAGMNGGAASSPASEDALGLTLMGLTPHYLVVLNIVGPEQMYSPGRAATVNPTEGEMILHGSMAKIVPGSRHTEAHIYSRTTGLPATDTVPTMIVTDLDAGTTVHPEQTLMQDVVIGSRDIHFGNNVAIARDHDFRITVAIGNEEVDFHGQLL